MRLENPLIKLIKVSFTQVSNAKCIKMFWLKKNERMRQGRGSIASSHKFKRQTFPR